MPEFVVRAAANLAAIWVAAEIFDGVTYGDSFWTLVLAALVFTVVNSFVKPVLAILSIPLIIVTFGIAYFLVNCLMLVLTAWVVPDFEAGSFWTVVGATVVIWLVNMVIGAAMSDIRRSRQRRYRYG
jgi:putative membrane protein